MPDKPPPGPGRDPFKRGGWGLSWLVCLIAGHDDQRLPVPDGAVGGAFAPCHCRRCGRETETLFLAAHTDAAGCEAAA